jgi:hypothetical protein
LAYLGSGQEGLVFADKPGDCYYKVLLWRRGHVAASIPGKLQQLQQLLDPAAVAEAGGFTFGVHEVETWGPHGVIRYGPYMEGECCTINAEAGTYGIAVHSGSGFNSNKFAKAKIELEARVLG